MLMSESTTRVRVSSAQCECSFAMPTVMLKYQGLGFQLSMPKLHNETRYDERISKGKLINSICDDQDADDVD